MIRLEGAGDHAAVRDLLLRAFPGPAEADLVDALRAAGDLILALVAEGGSVVGMIGFSRVTIAGSSLRAAALAPVAVAPERQRHGLGSALIREGLARLRAAGEDLILVLGEPAFYARFGFERRHAARLRTPYDGPYLQAMPLNGRGLKAEGAVHYAPAFSALG
jgi:putative acetyltransferase